MTGAKSPVPISVENVFEQAVALATIQGTSGHRSPERISSILLPFTGQTPDSGRKPASA